MFLKDINKFILLILPIEGSLSGEHLVNECTKEVEIERLSMALVP